MNARIENQQREEKFMSKQVCGPLHSEIALEEKLLYYRKRFYSDSKSFHSFDDLAPDFNKKSDSIINARFSDEQFPQKNWKKYLSILTYLMNSKENKDFASFDEKIAFLIQAIDPELSIYFYFLGCGYSASASKESSHSIENGLIDFIQSTVGCFDTQFLKYEEIYFRKVLKPKHIISHIHSDFSSHFFENCQSIHSFEEIRQIEFQLLSKKADYYRINCETPHSINTLCFNMNNPNSILELWNIPYKIIFFILVIDPSLEALRIYAEESQISGVQKRMMEEFGFYHEDFIRLEEMYRRKFFPEMKISEWEL